MEQRAFADDGTHVAIIMDGNGRWAAARGRPRSAGHRAGARAARRIVEAAPGLGVRHLTLYAFSSDNWRRPAPEVAGLMRLFGAYLRAETRTCVERGVRLTVLGRRDRLPLALLRAIREAEEATSCGGVLDLRLAVDYSARDAIALTAARGGVTTADRRAFARALAARLHAREPVPDVDLLIRSGGERRLSDFLLWECAYAELVFTDRLWPDFEPADLAAALAEFGRRERRFGGLTSMKEVVA